MSQLDKIDKRQLPLHIAIIMDGNGRWAQEKGEDRLFGHYQGVESVRNIVEGCAELGIAYLTLYAFSTENWDRPEPEVNKNNIKLHLIGNIEMLPEYARKGLEEAIDLTKNNTGLTLIIALSYSSRWQLVQAVKGIAADVQAGKISPDQIDQNTLRHYLATSAFPDPELMIRTSGEYRISNFLLYQLAYAELYFTDTRWPDFGKEHLYEAILNFQQRQRRFGKTGGQIQRESATDTH
ncbi:MAG TPA: polyprenyl diphosphate synthase [Agriterribacter sp.]|nr:polyprenyl diphosphate synthase [Agriterribacter sp.]